VVAGHLCDDVSSYNTRLMPYLPERTHKNKRPAKKAWKPHPEASFYNSAAWRRIRLSYLAEHPLCEIHESVGQVVAANVVDHIIPHRKEVGGAKFDIDNFCAMCKSCHDLKSSYESQTPYLVPFEFRHGGKVAKDKQDIIKYMSTKINV